MGALKRSRKYTKRQGGRPASPTARVVRIGPDYRPVYPNLLGGPITPEEHQRNVAYALRRMIVLGL